MAAEISQKVIQKWGTAVRSERRKLGLSQVQLAKRAGYPQSTISEIEKGAYKLHPELLIRLAAALETEPSDLFDWPFGIGMVARHEMGAA